MKTIINELKNIKNKFNLEEYPWMDIIDAPIELKGENSFEKNIYLKNNLHLLMQKNPTFDIYYWIINQWGGISGFKRNLKNDGVIRDFLQRINGEKKLTKQTANVISSLSKIASFQNPYKYSIYDSRVIFAFNWLLIKSEKNPILFPQPTGRGEATKLDLHTIIDLAKIQISTASHKTSYYEYCKLMKYFSSEIFNDSEKPYLSEMLLFMAADPKIIGSDIRSSIELKISTNYS